MDFVHLETQSAYSFLWGSFTPEELALKAKEFGHRAVALTDSGLYGAPRFYKAALNSGIQPILGAKVPIWDGSKITLLVTDFQSYGNLCRLLSVVYGRGILPKYPITQRDLAALSRGLICLVGGHDSRIHRLFHENRIHEAIYCLEEIKAAIRNPDFLFLALQNHASTPEDFRRCLCVIDAAYHAAKSIGVKTVATNAVVFLNPEDYEIHQTLVAVQQKHHHRKVTPVPNDRFYFTDGAEMVRRIPYPEAVENTLIIAERCAGFTLPVGRLHPPVFQDPVIAARKLTSLSYREAAVYCRPMTFSYVKRLDEELEIINRRRLADFFLLVRQVIEFTREKNIRHSILGSAAGSLVVYLLLGGVDPVAHNLLFERFINNGRGDLPDIDIDFDSERRDEVIRHIMELFPEQTAMVATIHSLRARSAVRLTARALGYSLAEIDKLASCLPWSLRGRDLLGALETLPELKNSPIKYERRLMEVAGKMTGLPFQSSVHLGGVIIAPGNITDWTPVSLSPKGFPVGQLDKDDVETLGLLKLDILGLRMHTAIRKALDILAAQGVLLEPARIPLTDRKTYAILKSGESLGVFQLESPGQRNLLGRLQPRIFSDIIAEISLFRPGPVEGNMVETYVRRRNEEEPVEILHSVLSPVLDETYGIILFQEQVLRVAHVFAGLTYSEADAFRRAMTKERKGGKMESLKNRFIQGALEKGHSPELAEKVFAQVGAFASYGFCKAHAASFAHICYQSAYLKAHHSQAFYLGLLNAGHVGSYPPSVILNEARRRGVSVYGPHINMSGFEYSVDGSGIRVPLNVIYAIGPAFARKIVRDRLYWGPFQSLCDFTERISPPPRILQFLNLAGALKGLPDQWELTQEVYYA